MTPSQGLGWASRGFWGTRSLRGWRAPSSVRGLLDHLGFRWDGVTRQQALTQVPGPQSTGAFPGPLGGAREGAQRKGSQGPPDRTWGHACTHVAQRTGLRCRERRPPSHGPGGALPGGGVPEPSHSRGPGRRRRPSQLDGAEATSAAHTPVPRGAAGRVHRLGGHSAALTQRH